MTARRTALFRSATAIAAGATALLAVAGCTTQAATTSTTTTTDTDSSTDSSTGGTDSGTSSTGTYTDGTYTASGSYQTPGGQSAVDVTVTLEDDVITDVEVVSDTTIAESQQYQSQFISGIAAEVVGKDIDDLNVSRVAGSSLTSGGFNSAIETIKQEAAA